MSPPPSSLCSSRVNYLQHGPGGLARDAWRSLTLFINNGDLSVCEFLRGHSEMPREDLTRVRNVTWNRRFFAATVNQKSNKNEDTDAQKLDESEDSDGHQTAKDLALDPEKMVDTPDGAVQDEKTSDTSQSQAGVSESGSSGDNDECDSDDTHHDSSKGDNGDEEQDDEDGEERKKARKRESQI